MDTSPSHLAFYRKYRPQSLTEVIGQVVAKNALLQAFKTGKLSHAYLFCGSRGTGKTSTARILAKMVNCENVNRESLIVDRSNKDADDKRSTTNDIPCNTCDSCLSITDGSNLDLIEIDAASNRGIDDIRELREKIKLSPTSANKKVYIIDEVHMLTNEAFNALLKTLEEPPSHVLFILATTEVHKIPSTILSRVQKLDFQQATIDELSEALKKVAEAEKLEVEEEALRLIAKKGEGSFRDSLKLLEQLASHKKITTEIVEQTFKSGDFANLIKLLSLISGKDSKGALEILHQDLESGANIKEYILSLMDLLRLLMFSLSGAENVIKNNLSSNKYEQVLPLTKSFKIEEVIKILDNFQNALEKLKFASIPSLPLEVAVVESCQLSVFSSQSSDNSQPVISQSVLETEKQKTDKLQSENREQKTDNIIAVEQITDSPKADSGLAGMTDNEGSDSLPKVTSDSTSDDLSKLMDKWTYILETIKPFNFSLEALLRQVRVVNVEDSILLLEVPYSFHQRILEAPKSRNLLESVLADVLEKPIRVSCTLGKRPLKVEELANVELAADDEIIRVAAEIFNSDQVS